MDIPADQMPAKTEEIAQLFSVLLKVDCGLEAVENLINRRVKDPSEYAADLTDTNVVMDGAFYMAFGVRGSDLMPYDVENPPAWVTLWNAAYQLAHTNRFYHGSFVYTPDSGGSGSDISYVSAWTSLLRWYRNPEDIIARLLAYPNQPMQISTGNIHYRPHQLADYDSVKGWQGMHKGDFEKIITET